MSGHEAAVAGLKIATSGLNRRTAALWVTPAGIITSRSKALPQLHLSAISARSRLNYPVHKFSLRGFTHSS
jgi:hypothetical protein